MPNSPHLNIDSQAHLNNTTTIEKNFTLYTPLPRDREMCLEPFPTLAGLKSEKICNSLFF